MLTSNAFAQRTIGHVDLQHVINTMPEGVKAQAEMDALFRSKQVEFDKMTNEINEEIADYEKNKDQWSEQERAKKEAELSQKQQQHQQLLLQSEQELHQQYAERLDVVVEKAREAVKVVAAQNGYDYVFTVGADNSLLVYPESDDITPLVLRYLGVE